MSNKQFDYNQVPKGHYEKIIWEDQPIRKFWHVERFREMEELLLDRGKNLTLLDYGCASGSFLGYLPKHYQMAYGADIASPQVDLANQKYGSEKLKFLCSDFTALPFKKGSFDAIINSEVIEHVSHEESKDMLVSFRDLLKPDGRLLLSTPNYISFWPFIEFFVNRLSEVDYEHQHINKLDIPKCKKLLKETGFEIDKLVTIFVIAPFLAPLSYKASQKIFGAEKKLIPNLGSLILLSAKKS